MIWGPTKRSASTTYRWNTLLPRPWFMFIPFDLWGRRFGSLLVNMSLLAEVGSYIPIAPWAFPGSHQTWIFKEDNYIKWSDSSLPVGDSLYSSDQKGYYLWRFVVVRDMTNHHEHHVDNPATLIYYTQKLYHDGTNLTISTLTSSIVCLE